MADRFLSLAAYFSGRGSAGGGAFLGDVPPRPQGSVVWVRANRAEQLDALNSLSEQLQADGDQITLIVTLPKGKGVAQDMPQGRGQLRAFLKHWQPDLVLWLEADLDPDTLAELSKTKVPCILACATRQAVRPTSKAWVPGMTRVILRQFVAIMTVDDPVQRLLRRHGANPQTLETLGALENAPAALPHFEGERQDYAGSLGARSMWLAADIELTEADRVAQAHHEASRRAHRLLLIVTLRDATQGIAVAEHFSAAGFSVARRSAGEEPSEANQVYIADAHGEMGLWYRISPITFLGGTLSGGPCRDPFEAATLGSAVLHGPDVAPYHSQIDRLLAANACVPLTSFDDLGRTVETLLSPDKTAQIVHAGWDVTSRGAEVINRLAEAVIDQLDQTVG